MSDMRPQPTREPTYPRYNTTRQTPRRWPLVLRVGRGGVHWDILVPVVLHAAISCMVVYLHSVKHFTLGLPSSIVPSLSIVVGLMLVFRNQTSYERFWNGRHNVTTMVTVIRNLSRQILTNCSPLDEDASPGFTPPDGSSVDEHMFDDDDEATTIGQSKRLNVPAAERADTEKTVRMMLAIMYATKHNLRHEWTSSRHETTPTQAPSTASNHARPFAWLASQSNTNLSIISTTASGATTPLLSKPEYLALLPPGMSSFEEDGLGLPLQLSVGIEAYIRRALQRNWVNGPQASQLSIQVNSLVDAIGRMEQIRTTPLPVAHLIHQRQVLAAFGCVLPFAMVDELGWWTVLIVSVVTFTLYGIEGIGSQLEDPFGYDRNDIAMDDIVEDTRREILVMLQDWKDSQKIFLKYR